MIKRTLILLLAASSCAFAQNAGTGGPVFFQSTTAVATAGMAPFEKDGTPVVGAPYSATVTNESIQMLSDGNRIVQSLSGTIARDSQGRIRQDAPLPAIGNLAAANPPHIVFIRDPVAQASYTLNLTDKTAQKMPPPPALPPNVGMAGGPGPVIIQNEGGGGPQIQGAFSAGGPLPLPPVPPPTAFFVQKAVVGNDKNQEAGEDLGSQTMQGVLVNGTRTTRTIPAGQIGNDKPIQIVTEVWTSPDLQTIVYSKRTDPRMGEQTFQLTNIQRGEPDSSLFTVPSDFKVLDGPQNIFYRTNQ